MMYLRPEIWAGGFYLRKLLHQVEVEGIARDALGGAAVDKKERMTRFGQAETEALKISEFATNKDEIVKTMRIARLCVTIFLDMAIKREWQDGPPSATARPKVGYLWNSLVELCHPEHKKSTKDVVVKMLGEGLGSRCCDELEKFSGVVDNVLKKMIENALDQAESCEGTLKHTLEAFTSKSEQAVAARAKTESDSLQASVTDMDMIVTEYTLPEQLLARLKEQVQSAVEVMNNASEVSVGWGCCQLLNVIKSTEAKILQLEGPGKPKDQAQKEKAEKEVQKQRCNGQGEDQVNGALWHSLEGQGA